MKHNNMKTVFVYPERCVACYQCELACKVEQSQSKDLRASLAQKNPAPRSFIVALPGKRLDSSFPKKCFHCSPAPCETVCGAGAISRDANMNTVKIDIDKCVLCGMCALVCPFGIITFSPSSRARHEKPVATKCDNCIERQQQGMIPACVEACKAGALQFGDVDEMLSKVRLRTGESLSVVAGSTMSNVNNTPSPFKAWLDWRESVRKINQR